MVSRKFGKARWLLSMLALGGAMVVSGNAAAECKLFLPRVAVTTPW